MLLKKCFQISNSDWQRFAKLVSAQHSYFMFLLHSPTHPVYSAMFVFLLFLQYANFISNLCSVYLLFFSYLECYPSNFDILLAIILLFWWSEIQNGSYRTKIKVPGGLISSRGARGQSVLCFFQLLVDSVISWLWLHLFNLCLGPHIAFSSVVRTLWLHLWSTKINEDKPLHPKSLTESHIKGPFCHIKWFYGTGIKLWIFFELFIIQPITR